MPVHDNKLSSIKLQHPFPDSFQQRRKLMGSRFICSSYHQSIFFLMKTSFQVESVKSFVYYQVYEGSTDDYLQLRPCAAMQVWHPAL